MPKTTLDRYPQKAILETTISTGLGATVTTLKKLETGITNLQKIAWDVKRIRFAFDNEVMANMNTALEYRFFGISASSSPSQNSNFTNASLYDYLKIDQAMTAVAGAPSWAQWTTPIDHDFPQGLLVLPQNIYAITRGYDSAAALGPWPCHMEIDYLEIEIGPEDWYDLLQMRMPLGAV